MEVAALGPKNIFYISSLAVFLYTVKKKDVFLFSLDYQSVTSAVDGEQRHDEFLTEATRHVAA